MLSACFREDKDIIKVRSAVVIKGVMQNMVNIVLEYSGCVIETKWYN